MAVGTIEGTQNTLIEQPGSPHETRTAAGRTIARTFRYAGAGDPPVSAIGAAYDGLKLHQIDIRRISTVSKEVVYSYRDDALDIGLIPFSQLAETNTEFDSNTIEIPIEQHPDYDESWKETKPGITSYLDPQPVRRDINYQTVLDTNVDDIGKRGQNGYSVNWLFTRMSCRKIGVTRQNGGTLYDVFERTREYQYARNGWDSAIYSWI